MAIISRLSLSRPRIALLLLFLAFFLRGPEAQVQDHSASHDSLSSRDRLRLFDQVWQLIKARYYDPSFNGVDWKAVREHYRPRVQAVGSDAEFYLQLKEMTGELHDAHTRFRSPGERQRADKLQATSPGIAIGEIDGTPVVITVDPDSEAARAGVEPGMIVTGVDGVPFAQRLAEVREEVGTSSSERATALISYFWIVSGEPYTKVRLGLRRDDGSQFEATLTRHLVPLAPPVISHVLSSGYAYLKFGIFNATVARQFKQALQKVRNAPGLIIDLRGNPGGDFQGMLRIADNFFPSRVSFGKVIGRSGKAPSLVLRILGIPSQLDTGHAGGELYAGPIVILVNEGSGSAAELFAADMQENGRAAVVGRQTCGCVLATFAHTVKGGGELDISEFSILTAKARRLEGTGVVPDVPVPLTLKDLRRHRDGALQEAIAILNSSGSPSASSSADPAVH